MRLRILLIIIAMAALAYPTVAQAERPCASQICTTHLIATEHVKHWVPRGSFGERWLLYLNIYDGRKRLAYLRLRGGCHAAYASPHISAVLHACRRRSTLDYVSFDGSRRLRVKYRYVRR